MAIAGHNLTLTVATGVSATYETLDGIMEFTLGDSSEVLDITDFADSRLRRKIVGLRDLTMTMGGDLEPTSQAHTNNVAAYEAGNAVFVKVTHDGTNGYTYAMVITELSRNANVDGKIAVSLSLEHEGSVSPIKIGTGF
jgi:predicted secreted protein